jgi:predicted TIM-barrel fold metal-dependent hydrolase
MADIIDINTLFGPRPKEASDLSLDDLLALRETYSVTTSFTLSTIGILLDFRSGNSATLAACSDNPGLLPTATINPQKCFDIPNTIDEIVQKGFKLLRVFPEIQDWEPDYAPFITLVRALKNKPLPLMVDVSKPGVASRIMKTCENSNVTVILSGVDETCLAEAVTLMQENPNLYMETSHLLGEGVIAHVARLTDDSKLLFGTGSPANPVLSSLTAIEIADITDSARSNILAGNARRLLNL